MSRREIYSPPVHRPRCCFVWSRSASISRDRTASTRRPEASDHHAKVVSRISARTATFHFLRDSGDLPAQTGRSHARSERRSSLWEESLSLRPGQVGSIPSVNDQWAGDDFSLAGAQGFEPRNGGTKNRCLTTWRRPSAGRCGELCVSRDESNYRN